MENLLQVLGRGEKKERERKEEKRGVGSLHDYTLPKQDRLRLYNSLGKLCMKQLYVRLGIRVRFFNLKEKGLNAQKKCEGGE